MADNEEEGHGSGDWDHGVDLDNAPVSIIKKHIATLRQVCNGQRDPGLDRDELEPSVPYPHRAQTVLKWALAMLDVQEEDEVFDEGAATEVTARRLLLVQQLYKNLSRFVRNMDPLESALDEQATHAEYYEWWRALGHVHTVLVNIDKIGRCLHILTRVLYNEEDQITGNVLTNPVRSYQETEFLRAWSQAHGVRGVEDAAKQTPLQIVVNHCLDQAIANRYKKLGSVVYEEKKVTFNGVVYGTRAYLPVEWPNGDPRRDKSTISEFVTHACARERHPQIWPVAMDETVHRKVVAFLERTVDVNFPSLRKQRHLFSFNNGIYDSKEGQMGAFYSYDRVAYHLHPSATAAKFFDQDVRAQWFEASCRLGGWFDIPTPHFQSILDYQNFGTVRPPQKPPQHSGDEAGHETATLEIRRALYGFLETMENAVLDSEHARFPQAKRDALASMPLHCQSLRQVIEEAVARLGGGGVAAAAHLPGRGSSEEDAAPPQGGGGLLLTETSARVEPGKELPPEVQRWIYIFLGRMLHDLNTFDAWQIMPFLKGKAGTGKSAIGLVAKAFFELEQVGILSSNIETKFGLGALADAFIILCLEVKKNFQLNQAEFQSIVSGELIQLAVKNKDAFAKKWSAPGLLCGNEWASYQDAQGSIARRLAIINFKFPISEKDSNPNLLDLILSQELACLLVKCNMGYREQAMLKKGQDIWKILPVYFKQQRRMLQIETDPLWATIWDLNLFEHTPTGFVSFIDFQKEYQTKWKQIRATPFPEHLTNDKLEPALKEAKLTRAMALRVDPGLGGDARMDDWIFGLRLRRDIPDNEGGATRAGAAARASGAACA